jgi:hypothetical protein
VWADTFRSRYRCDHGFSSVDTRSNRQTKLLRLIARGDPEAVQHPAVTRLGVEPRPVTLGGQDFDLAEQRGQFKQSVAIGADVR